MHYFKTCLVCLKRVSMQKAFGNYTLIEKVAITLRNKLNSSSTTISALQN